MVRPGCEANTGRVRVRARAAAARVTYLQVDLLRFYLGREGAAAEVETPVRTNRCCFLGGGIESEDQPMYEGTMAIKIDPVEDVLAKVAQHASAEYAHDELHRKNNDAHRVDARDEHVLPLARVVEARDRLKMSASVLVMMTRKMRVFGTGWFSEKSRGASAGPSVRAGAVCC